MSILLGSATIFSPILRLFCRTGPLFQWKSLSRTRSIVKSIERRGGAKLRLGLVFLRRLLVTWQVSSNQPRDRINFSSVPPLGPICPKQITTDYVRLALLGGNDPEEVLSTSIHVIFCSLLNKELTLSQQIIPSLYRFSPEPITYFVDIQEDILKRKWWRLWKRTRQLANNTVAKNSWIVAETRAIIPASEIFLEHASSPLQETAIILLLEAITISWSWSRFVSYRRRNIGPFQKRLKVAEMIQPTLAKMT